MDPLLEFVAYRMAVEKIGDEPHQQRLIRLSREGEAAQTRSEAGPWFVLLRRLLGCRRTSAEAHASAGRERLLLPPRVEP